MVHLQAVQALYTCKSVENVGYSYGLIANLGIKIRLNKYRNVRHTVKQISQKKKEVTTTCMWMYSNIGVICVIHFCFATYYFCFNGTSVILDRGLETFIL